MIWRVILLAFVTLLVGCTQVTPRQPISAPVEVERTVAPTHIIPPPPPAATSAAPPSPEVALLVSSNIPAYRIVAEGLASELGARAKIWYLDGTQAVSAKAIEEIEHSHRPQVVAIGLAAAVSSKNLTEQQVIFCQLFNYDDYQLPSPQRKGVSMLPSFDKTFAEWRKISPGLHKVAIITGPGVEDYIEQAQRAAKANNIILVHQVVNSDKEFLLRYKSLADSVQGYWLWPDNRILSTSVLREVMTYSVRAGKQVLVFSDELLMLGGMLSATSDYRDIITNVLKRLKESEGKESIPGPVIEPLDKVNLKINPVMARRFDVKAQQ